LKEKEQIQLLKAFAVILKTKILLFPFLSGNFLKVYTVINSFPGL